MVGDHHRAFEQCSLQRCGAASDEGDITSGQNRVGLPLNNSQIARQCTVMRRPFNFRLQARRCRDDKLNCWTLLLHSHCSLKKPACQVAYF